MNSDLLNISNIEKFCKKYHLEELAAKEEKEFEDYKKLLDAMLSDSKAHARNIKIIKGVSSGIASIGGAISGWQLVEGIKNRNAGNIVISVGVGLLSIFGTAFTATKLTQKELDNIRDNAIFAQGMYSVSNTSDTDSASA